MNKDEKPQKRHILVVEDEEAIARGLADCLVFHGHEVELIHDGAQALAIVQKAAPGFYDLCLLDIMLPGANGIEICRAAREAGHQSAICMLTAKGSEEDVLAGFAAGADDYVSKPFSVAQLMARIEALLRRIPQVEQIARDKTEQTEIRLGPLRINAAALQLRTVENEENTIDINRRDLAILQLFQREAGRIISRRYLLQQAWGVAHPEMIETRSVDMHLVKLRRKIEKLQPGLMCIETIRGEGYRMPAQFADEAIS